MVGSGIVPTALEFLDGETLACGGGVLPRRRADGAGFLVIAEADGSLAEAARLRAELVEAPARARSASTRRATARSICGALALARGLAFAVIARRGGMVGEDIVVPLDRLEEAIEETLEIGRRHDLIGLALRPRRRRQPALDLPRRPARSRTSSPRAEPRAEELFELAVRLGGSISGEHGIGWPKRGRLARQWSPRASSSTRRSSGSSTRRACSTRARSSRGPSASPVPWSATRS